MHELLLSVLAFGDVACNDDVATYRRVVTQVGDAVLQPDPRSVLVHGADRRGSRHGRSRRLGVGEGGTQAREVVGMHELAVHPEPVLLWRVAQDAVERRAGVLHLPSRAHDDDEVADVLHQ